MPEEEFGDQYTPIIEAPYRWRDWANPEDIRAALKGDELIEFINHTIPGDHEGKEPPRDPSPTWPGCPAWRPTTCGT